MNRGPLADLQARWSGAIDALHQAALDAADPGELARLLARAEQLSECDLDLRRARRELLGL